MRLACVGTNYRQAPVAARERLAVARDELPAVLERVRQDSGAVEAMLLSTCNRIELYVVVPSSLDLTATVNASVAAAFADEEARAWLSGHAYVHEGNRAVFHLFRVAASLDSMVVGEPQITGQVREAWEAAEACGAAGPVLHRTVERALKVAARVRRETRIAEGSVSIGSVAVDLARRIFGELDGCAVLLLGAGEMAEHTAIHLAGRGATDVTVLNRTPARAEALATEHGWKWGGLDAIEEALGHSDIVVVSTGSRTPVLTRKLVERAVRRRPMRPVFVVDISVPRNVEDAVGNVDGVYLYNVDDLEEIAAHNRDRRAAHAAQAEAIVREELRRFEEQESIRALAPLIAALQRKAQRIREAELARTARALEALSPKDRKRVEKMAAAMFNKFLHDPMTRLRAAAGTDHGARLVDAMRELFALDESNSADAAADATAERGASRPDESKSAAGVSGKEASDLPASVHRENP